MHRYVPEKTQREDLMRKETFMVAAGVALGLGLNLFAQQAGPTPAAPGKTAVATSLLFREDFPPGKTRRVQLTQDGIANPNLELKLYGPGTKHGNTTDLSGILLSNEEDQVNNGRLTSMVFSGIAEGSWAVMLKDKNNYLDLRNTARLHWRVRARSLHQLRPVVKLADGTMWAADYTEQLSAYFHQNEVYFVDIVRWRELNPITMGDARAKPGEPLWKTNLDLSKVDEIGFTDLMAGGGDGTQGNVSVDWIEVYGNPVKRTVAQSQR
jgi:hypothetical protein